MPRRRRRESGARGALRHSAPQRRLLVRDQRQHAAGGAGEVGAADDAPTAGTCGWRRPPSRPARATLRIHGRRPVVARVGDHHARCGVSSRCRSGCEADADQRRELLAGDGLRRVGIAWYSGRHRRERGPGAQPLDARRERVVRLERERGREGIDGGVEVAAGFEDLAGQDQRARIARDRATPPSARARARRRDRRPAARPRPARDTGTGSAARPRSPAGIPGAPRSSFRLSAAFRAAATSSCMHAQREHVDAALERGERRVGGVRRLEALRARASRCPSASSASPRPASAGA